MFTGIIEFQGKLLTREKQKEGLRLCFEARGGAKGWRLGESVAIDGVCLTVSKRTPSKFWTDVIPETLESTTLGDLRVGDPVNLERALRVGDRLGGHWVTGHVDGVGTICKLLRNGPNLSLQIEAPPATITPLVSKGSIAVDGISFTVQSTERRSFVVGVTPHTWRATTLHRKREGDRVNLETDLLAKLMAKKEKAHWTQRELRRQGF